MKKMIFISVIFLFSSCVIYKKANLEDGETVTIRSIDGQKKALKLASEGDNVCIRSSEYDAYYRLTSCNDTNVVYADIIASPEKKKPLKKFINLFKKKDKASGTSGKSGGQSKEIRKLKKQLEKLQEESAKKDEQIQELGDELHQKNKLLEEKKPGKQELNNEPEKTQPEKKQESVKPEPDKTG